MINWKSRLKSYPFWVAIFALIAITGQTFGIYQVPEYWTTWVNCVLSVMVLGGVIADPTTKGYKD